MASSHRENNFDFLRSIAVLLVIFGHCRALSGKAQFFIWSVPISTLGVLIFFSLSGYLVTESWLRQPSGRAFFRKRCLRIFPALIICIILTACVLGPLVTTLDIADYVANPQFGLYFWNCVMRIYYQLPGVFTENTYPAAVNGSLWTLPVEFFCYILIFFIGAASRRVLSFRLLLVACGAVGLASLDFYFSFFYHGQQIVFFNTDVASATNVMPYFFIGSMIRLLEEEIDLRLDVALLLVGCLVVAQSLGLWRTVIVIGWLAIPYTVIVFGKSATPVCRRWGQWGDLSYGMYLYSFPIQQTIMKGVGKELTTMNFFVVSSVVSALCAAASWHLIEKRALRFKNRPKPTAAVVQRVALDRISA